MKIPPSRGGRVLKAANFRSISSDVIYGQPLEKIFIWCIENEYITSSAGAEVEVEFFMVRLVSVASSAVRLRLPPAAGLPCEPDGLPTSRR